MFQETLIRAESQYRMARAQEAAGRTRRRRFGGGRDATPTSGAHAYTPNDTSRLVPPAMAEPVPSTIDEDIDVRDRQPAAI